MGNKQQAEQEQGTNIDDNNDSDKTVDYTTPDNVNKNADGETTSLKGVMKYKHYGIKWRSPSVPVTVRRMRCFICQATLDSKKQLNDHH